MFERKNIPKKVSRISKTLISQQRIVLKKK